MINYAGSKSSDSEQTCDSDSEPPSSRISARVEKRQYHNFLERSRRNLLKYSFDRLRSVIPSLANKSSREASRAKTLKRAIEFLRRKAKNREARVQAIRDLQRENAILEKQYLLLKQAEETGDMSQVDTIFKQFDEIKQRAYDHVMTESEVSDEDTDDAEDVEAEEQQPVQNLAEWATDNEEEEESAPPLHPSWSVSVAESDSDSSESSEDSLSDISVD